MKCKGVVNIEFILSVVVFLTATVFISITVINVIPSIESESARNNMKMRAYQISNILLFDSGYPEDWNSGNAERIGLSGGMYEIDKSKVASLQEICKSDYENLSSLFGSDLNIEITADGNSILSCKSPHAARRFFELKRYSTVEKKVAEISVVVIE